MLAKQNDRLPCINSTMDSCFHSERCKVAGQVDDCPELIVCTWDPSISLYRGTSAYGDAFFHSTCQMLIDGVTYSEEVVGGNGVLLFKSPFNNTLVALMSL
jgi:hypothetical protein